MRTRFGWAVALTLTASLAFSSVARAACERCGNVPLKDDDPDTHVKGHSDHREWVLLIPPNDDGRLNDCFLKKPQGQTTTQLRHSTADVVWMSAQNDDRIQFTNVAVAKDSIFVVHFTVSPFAGSFGRRLDIEVKPSRCSRVYKLDKRAKDKQEKYRFEVELKNSKMPRQVAPDVGADG